MLTLCFFFFLFTKGIFSLTVTSSPEINVTLGSNSSITLNCTYVLEENEFVGFINWKKKINNDLYESLANFFYKSCTLTQYGTYLLDRSELQSYGNGSNSAVLIIKGVRCEDVGQYQCSIAYGPGDREAMETHTLVYVQADAEKPSTFFIHPNDILVEHEQMTLSCSATVGSPQGSLALWTKKETSSTWEQLKNISDIQNNNCMYIANLTETHILTRQDNGAKFGCSSQNQYTKEPALATDIGPIEVLYGTSFTTIEASDLNFCIDDIVNLKCISDGNPKANNIWKFNHTEIGRNAKYNISVDKSELSFTVTDITDNGYYQCVASNYIKGQWFNSSSNITLTVREIIKEEYLLELEKTCNENPCSSVQNCVVKDGRAFCLVNIWIVIAIVFIIITLILFTTTLSLILLRRAKRLKIVTNAEETDMGGYLSPVGEANGSNYEVLGQNTVHVYSTMQNRDLISHGSNYEALGQGTVHVYFTMQNRDLN